MSDEDDFDAEKTQIFLPGGGNKPASSTNAAEDDNKGVLLKPNRTVARDQTAVDFDITTGSDSAKPPPAARPAPPAAASGPGAVSIIVGLIIAAAVAWFVLR